MAVEHDLVDRLGERERAAFDLVEIVVGAVGLVRNRVFAHYFGTSDAADAFNADNKLIATAVSTYTKI